MSGTGLQPVCSAGILPACIGSMNGRKVRSTHRLQACATLLLALLLCSCSKRKTDKLTINHWDLFSPALIGKWQEAQLERSGGMVREANGITLNEGSPMTGIVFPSWLKDGIPVVDYAINYEAMRVSGSDFFGSVTFPVRDEKTFVTFVLGGWGGSQVGISCIDGYDASENTTGSSQRFENGTWYRVRIEVRAKELRVLLDARPIIQTNIAGRSLGLRGGEIAKCAPFGFATYGTEGRIRLCFIERLVAP